MKLLVILSRVPYPLDKGDKLRAYYQLRELQKHHEVTLCCLTDEPVPEKAKTVLASISSEYHIFKLKKWRVYLNLLLGFFSRKPFQVLYFYQRPIHREIAKIIERKDPDHIYCQLIRTSEYAKEEHNYRKTLDYQDAFSKGMERRADRASWPLKEIFNMERGRLVAYENVAFEYFEEKVIISAEDRRFIYHPEREKIHVITNGIDTSYFEPKRIEKPEFDLVFIGNLSYPPNIETALYIAQEVLPLLKESKMNIKVLIAGANPVKKVLNLSNTEGITVRGSVDDIRKAYASGAIFFAPMQIGTGLQNKLLEAMSMEIPCVTSALANKALKAPENECILVGNRPEEYANLILHLLKNNELQRKLGKEGRKFVRRNFSWESSTAALMDVMSAQSLKAVV